MALLSPTLSHSKMKLLLLSILPSALQAFAPPVSSRQQSNLQMFTGIIEEMGQVISLQTKDDVQLWDGTKGRGTELVVGGDVVLDGAYLG